MSAFWILILSFETTRFVASLQASRKKHWPLPCSFQNQHSLWRFLPQRRLKSNDRPLNKIQVENPPGKILLDQRNQWSSILESDTHCESSCAEITSPSVVQSSCRARLRRCMRQTLGILGVSALIGCRTAFGFASSATKGRTPPVYQGSLIFPISAWFALFILSASLHAAEISITTLYPWKVKEFAEEEGPTSPFQTLDNDITRVLTTVLVLTTVCQVVSTMLFTIIVAALPQVSLSQGTLFLTFFTLFFGELIPKALGVANAEGVARAVVPYICFLAVFFSPIGSASSWLTKKVLSLFGIESGEMGVSEEELRLIVMGAKQSGGIETEEAKMVEGVLDLQDMRVSEVMKPRIKVEALEANATLVDFMELVNATKYSRIPVYDIEIDQIIGVAIAKDIFVYVILYSYFPVRTCLFALLVSHTLYLSFKHFTCFSYRYAMEGPKVLANISVRELMEPTYFVPEFMVVQKVLEEMRRRRVHMAIVVDEYGGTAGVVTLEDILEEVVGEIYDEGDEYEEAVDEDNIMLLDDGRFELRGIADLDDVCLALNLTVNESDDRRDIGTISGFLCDEAGEIPLQGDVIIADGFAFTVTEADERRILLVHAESIENLERRFSTSEGSFKGNDSASSLEIGDKYGSAGITRIPGDFEVFLHSDSPGKGISVDNGSGTTASLESPISRISNSPGSERVSKRRWLREDGFMVQSSSPVETAASDIDTKAEDVFDGILPS